VFGSRDDHNPVSLAFVDRVSPPTTKDSGLVQGGINHPPVEKGEKPVSKLSLPSALRQ
jgi:hypothetical protein